MRGSRWLVIALFAALCLTAGTYRAQAQEDVLVVQPLGPCSGLPEGYAFTQEIPEYGIGPHEACDVAGLYDLGDYTPVCPVSTRIS